MLPESLIDARFKGFRACGDLDLFAVAISVGRFLVVESGTSTVFSDLMVFCVELNNNVVNSKMM